MYLIEERKKENSVKKIRRFIVSEFVTTCDELLTYKTNSIVANYSALRSNELEHVVILMRSQTTYVEKTKINMYKTRAA